MRSTPRARYERLQRRLPAPRVMEGAVSGK
jgi:hypothetical protein